MSIRSFTRRLEKLEQRIPMRRTQLIITDQGVQLGTTGKAYGLEMLDFLLEGDHLPWQVVDLREESPVNNILG